MFLLVSTGFDQILSQLSISPTIL